MEAERSSEKLLPVLTPSRSHFQDESRRDDLKSHSVIHFQLVPIRDILKNNVTIKDLEVKPTKPIPLQQHRLPE